MAKIQEQMRNHGAMMRDAETATAAWCAPDLPAGEERAHADSTICSRRSEKLEMEKNQKSHIDELR